MVDQVQNRKRKRITGEFNCIDCGKKFSRTDHLNRHRRNHDPNFKRYLCNWIGCQQSFIRKDVKERHYERHLKNSGSPLIDNQYGQSLQHNDNSNEPHSSKMFNTAAKVPVISDPPQALNIKSVNINISANCSDHANICISQSKLGNRTADVEIIKNAKRDDLCRIGTYESDSRENIIGCTLLDLRNFFIDPIKILNLDGKTVSDIMEISPSMAHQWDGPDVLLDAIRLSIPELLLFNDFSYHDIKTCLESHWVTFQAQYPIINKHLLDITGGHPILSISMIMVGSYFLTFCPKLSVEKKNLHVHVSSLIASRLQGLIMAEFAKDKIYGLELLQSLLLLDFYEISTGNINSQFKIYLARNLKIEMAKELFTYTRCKARFETHLWKMWLILESLNRVLNFSVILNTELSFSRGIIHTGDIDDTIIPVDDKFWKCNNIESANSLVFAKSETASNLLKRLLKGETIEPAYMSKKILLCICSKIAFQLTKSMDSKSHKVSIEKLALNLFYVKQCDSSRCAHSNTCVYSQWSNSNLVPPALRCTDSRSKLSLYYCCQFLAGVPLHDLLSYVQLESSGYKSPIQAEHMENIKTWVQSRDSYITLLNAYLLLFEMYLCYDNDDINYRYLSEADPLILRSTHLIHAVFVVFVHNYVTLGPETHVQRSSFQTNLNVIEKEDGYTYLRRIRDHINPEFTDYLLGYRPHPIQSQQKVFAMCAHSLQGCENRNNSLGLLKLAHESLNKNSANKELSAALEKSMKLSMGIFS